MCVMGRGLSYQGCENPEETINSLSDCKLLGLNSETVVQSHHNLHSTASMSSHHLKAYWSFKGSVYGNTFLSSVIYHYLYCCFYYIPYLVGRTFEERECWASESVWVDSSNHSVHLWSRTRIHHELDILLRSRNNYRQYYLHSLICIYL